jgi:hypothetical protein
MRGPFPNDRTSISHEAAYKYPLVETTTWQLRELSSSADNIIP